MGGDCCPAMGVSPSGVITGAVIGVGAGTDGLFLAAKVGGSFHAGRGEFWDRGFELTAVTRAVGALVIAALETGMEGGGALVKPVPETGC
jgi:hypothetical protein